MSQPKSGGGGRNKRWPGRGQGPRKTAGPTAPRMIAIKVVERVQRAGAYADLALHHALVQSRMPAPDRGLATELVYGTLRWRGRLDYLISKVLDSDPSKLEPLVTARAFGECGHGDLGRIVPVVCAARRTMNDHA
jgi:hypothetical protein